MRVTGPCARPIRIDAAPMPTKKIVIRWARLQRSPSQPTGSVPRPKVTKAAVPNASASPYDMPQAGASASTAVGKISRKKWS